MQQNKKFFGMTPRQIAILAGLIATACLLFGLAARFALRGGLTRSPNSPQGTPASQFTATPWMIPSPVPTGTATLLPYETLIPTSWLQFKSALVEIWLPAEFQPADPQLLNNSFNTAISELVVRDSREDSSAYPMLVIVSYEPLTADSLDAFLDAEVAKIPSDFRLAERKKITLNGVEAVRFVFEARFSNLEVNDLTYVFLDGGTVWYVEYIAQINEFYEMLSMFERSAQTFRLVR